jgi:hypothetical protein
MDDWPARSPRRTAADWLHAGVPSLGRRTLPGPGSVRSEVVTPFSMARRSHSGWAMGLFALGAARKGFNVFARLILAILLAYLGAAQFMLAEKRFAGLRTRTA